MHASIPQVPGKVMVVGFLFNRTKTLVALIRKNKPAWQQGKLNGVGGKIELDTNESPAEAMEREWVEETQTKPLLEGGGWREFCQMAHGENFIFFFEGTDTLLTEFPTPPDGEEEVDWYSVQSVVEGCHDMVENLKWLVPMALDKDRVTAKVHDPTAVQC